MTSFLEILYPELEPQFSLSRPRTTTSLYTRGRGVRVNLVHRHSANLAK